MAGTVTNSFGASDILLIFNRQTVGIANELNFTVDYSISAQNQLDSVTTRELIPGNYKVSGRVAGFLVRSVSLEQIGVFTAAGANLVQPYVSMQVLDRRSNQPIYTFPSLQISDLSVTTRASSNVLFDFSFVSFGCVTPQSQPLQPNYTGLPPSDS
jgi:hypothetical protein